MPVIAIASVWPNDCFRRTVNRQGLLEAQLQCSDTRRLRWLLVHSQTPMDSRSRYQGLQGMEHIPSGDVVEPHSVKWGAIRATKSSRQSGRAMCY
jgi:hypothetical protein